MKKSIKKIISITIIILMTISLLPEDFKVIENNVYADSVVNIYVEENGSDSGDGSKSNPYKKIQDAIEQLPAIAVPKHFFLTGTDNDKAIQRAIDAVNQSYGQGEFLKSLGPAIGKAMAKFEERMHQYNKFR